MSNLKEVGELIHSLTLGLNEYVDGVVGQEIGKIIKLHSAIAVVCGLVPIPVLDVLAGFLNIWFMYSQIGAAIGKPMSENFIKSILLGAIANLGSVLIFLIVIATLMQFIFVIGSIPGAIIMGFTLYTATVSAGVFYLKALQKITQPNLSGPLVSSKASGEKGTSIHTLVEEKEYYISRKDQRFGPYKYSELMSYVKSGNIKTDDYLWYSGLGHWTSVGEFLKNAYARHNG